MMKQLTRSLLTTLFISAAHTSFAATEIALEALPSAIASLTSNNQPEIDAIVASLKKHGAASLEELLKKHETVITKLFSSFTISQTYLKTLWEKTSWPQWAAVQEWFNSVEITAATCAHYVEALTAVRMMGFNPHNLIDAVNNDNTLFKIINNEATLETLFNHAYPEDKEILKKLLGKSDETLKTSIIQLFLLKDIPVISRWAMLTWTNKYNTQSKPHFFENAQSTLSLLKRATPEIRQALVEIYKKEREERAKGNYVFYHAQRWDLHYSADIYKQLWNVAHADSVGNDFTFFRFNQQNIAVDDRKDYLFMNHALFGNARRDGSCTVAYFMENYSIYGARFSVPFLCENLKLSKYYEKYAEKFAQLEQLHQQASSTGNLMLISIPADKIGVVRPVWPGGSPRTVNVHGVETKDTKTILDTLISNPRSITNCDDIEYTMPLTTEYALNPHVGPRVYSFNAADPEKLKAYETARDELFAKIKKDIEKKRI